jgi:diguanylate cyclase (GGDEF)-like protein
LTLRQELAVLSGVVLFIVGMVVSDPLLKLAAFLLSGSLLAFVALSLRSTIEQEEESGIEELIQPTPEEGSMKKLIFDDFQPVEKAYRVEVEEQKEPEVRIPTAHSSERPRRVTSESDIAALLEPGEEIEQGEPGTKSEFTYLLKKVLMLVKEVTFAHTVAFYWVNRTKNQVVLEAHATDSQHFATHRRRELAEDLVSQVALTGKPRVVTDVNRLSQPEMLGYYETIEPVKTFLGIPIFYRSRASGKAEPVAVLVIDSLSDDVFGPETFSLLSQFTTLIFALIRSYTDKYDLLLDSETLRSVSRMRDQLKLDFSVHNVVRSLAEETSRLVAWDYISVVLFDEARKAWNLQTVLNRINDSYVAIAQEVDPHQSIVGRVIQEGVPKIIDDMGKMLTPRFYPAERVDAKGSMMILPINSLSRCYGALAVESKDTKAYAEADIRMIQKLVETASWALESLTLTDIVNNYILMDETTGVATRKYFVGRLQEEVQRSRDFGGELAVVLLSVDAMNDHLARYGKDGFDFILQNIGRMIKASIRPYDLVGRYDFNRFAVLLTDTSSNEAYLWSEKLRKNIAGNVINVDNKSFSVTVSVGVCGFTGTTSDLELLENAAQVLRRATEAGGNIVRVF